MFSRNLTSRILKEAQTRGLLQDPHPGGEPVPDQVQDREADFWGMELASLVATGRMPEGTLHTLAWEAIGGEAGSWVDQLFKGPAPIGELKGLGDRYQDLVLVGEGASAYVYKGMDTLLQRHVAIKALKDARGPILAEARAQAKVEHPNVCRVYEVGQGYLVMQLVEGPTLAQLAHKLDVPEKARIIRDIALGVHAAHQKGLIHLDLKLNNVLMEGREGGVLNPIISDFGMVAGALPVEGRQVSLGTPPYTSPEQLARDGARLGPGADVYALGVMLYVLLAGAIPFEAHDFDGLLEAMANTPGVPLRRRAPHVPRDLEAIVAKCMAKRPEDRYASARELGEDLDRFLRGEPLAIKGGNLAYRAAKWLARNRKLQWVGAVSLMILALTLGLFTRHLRFNSQQAEWDHHFQGIVTELEAHLDRTYRLPAHDIRPELQRAEAYLVTMEEARKRGGAPAQGPACLALGQAHLLIDGNDDEATLYFQKAWDLGYRTESARSWLAISLLATYRKAMWSFIPGLADSANRGRADEVRRKYLEPARALLKGKGSPEQARLLFLVDLADAKTLDPGNLERWIRITQTYRAQFPNDLEGLFEEGLAFTLQANALLVTATLAGGSRGPRDLPEAEAFRRKGRMLLDELQRVAPSMPKVYAALAESYIQENALPTTHSAPTSQLFDQAQAWLDKGLLVRGDDPALIAASATFLGSQRVDFDLASGKGPGPLLDRLQSLRSRMGAAPDGACMKALVDASAASLATCRYYGVRPPPGLAEAFRGWVHEATEVQGASRFTRYATAARALLRAGDDPAPWILRLQEVPAPETPPELYELGSLDLVAADRAWLAQEDPGPWIARAQSLLPRMGEAKVFRSALAKEILVQRTKLVGDAGAWSAMEREVAELGAGDPSTSITVISQAMEYNAILARHAREANADARPWLRNLSQCLQHPAVKAYAWTPHYLEQEALVLLLGAPDASDPGAQAAAALERVDKALLQVLPPKASGPSGTVRLRPASFPDFQAAICRILPLKAEILVAMAACEHRPAQRIQLARKALAILAECLDHDPLLTRRLQPILTQARTLSRS